MPDCVEVIPRVSPPGAPRLRGARTLAWLALVLAASIGIAWGGELVGRARAPWLLFPILIGAAVGIAAGGLALACEWNHRPTWWLGALLAAVVTVVGMHWLAFRAELATPRSGELAIIRQAFPEIAERHGGAPPSGFLPFLRAMADRGRRLPFGVTAQGPWAWLTWGLDAALTAGTAVCVTKLLTRRPYCDHCGAYYRVVRRESLAGERLRGLARRFGWDLSPECGGEVRSLGCLACHGPELLDLRVSSPRGASRFHAWIRSSDRADLFRTLDQVG